MENIRQEVLLRKEETDALIKFISFLEVEKFINLKKYRQDAW